MKIFRLKSTYGKEHKVYINIDNVESVVVREKTVVVYFHQNEHTFNTGDYGLDDLLLEFAGLGLATFAEHRLLEAKVQAEWDEMEGENNYDDLP